MKHLRKFNEMSNQKLSFGKWVNRFFEKNGNHWESRYEKEVVGFAPSDLSHYTEEDLSQDYEKYLNDSFEDEDEIDFYNND